MTGLVGGDRQGTMFAVVGATGQQGGATVRALQAQDAGVRALARDPQAPAARALADGAVQVTQADIDDAESMRRAFTDVDGVFAMTTFAGPAATRTPVSGVRWHRPDRPHELLCPQGGEESYARRRLLETGRQHRHVAVVRRVGPSAGLSGLEVLARLLAMAVATTRVRRGSSPNCRPGSPDHGRVPER